MRESVIFVKDGIVQAVTCDDLQQTFLVVDLDHLERKYTTAEIKKIVNPKIKGMGNGHLTYQH